MRNKVKEFRRCAECEAKKSFLLCASCINNKALIDQLEKDEKRMDFLQKLLGRNKCILRDSVRGRGWRLHQTTREGSEHSVRLAIDNYMREYPEDTQ